MLGVNSPREPITPEFSREIREALRRAITGQPNEKERERDFADGENWIRNLEELNG